MAEIQFPQPPSPENPTTSPFTDQHGQIWVWNSKNWVRQAADPGISELTDPTQRDGQTYGRVWNKNTSLGEWELIWADVWYLGPYATPPTADNFGAALQKGHVYHNTGDLKMYAWNGVTWKPFSPLYVVNTIGEYVWSTLPADVNPGEPLAWPDDYGNQTSNWVSGKTFISVFKNGVRLLEEINSSLVLGDFTVDYLNDTITPVNSAFLTTDEIVVQVGEIDDADYIEVGDNNVSGWAFVIDEDDMISNLDTKVPTQQSVKQYTDLSILALRDEIFEALGGNTVKNVIGSVFDYAGLTPPLGALVCDGSEVPILGYQELYDILGDTWATTGGVANPAAENFRLPPSEMNGIGLTSKAATSAVPVGNYLASQNKRHKHDSTVGGGSGSNTGKANSHSHSITFGTGGFANGSSGKCLVTTGGSGSHTKSTDAQAAHSHSVSISVDSLDMANEGGDEARPESVTYLKCIWAY